MSKSRIGLLLLLMVSIIICGGYFAALNLQKQVNFYIFGLTKKLSQDIGRTVTVHSINTKWDFLHLNINLQDLMVTDQNSSVELVSANKIIVSIDPLATLFNMQLVFSKVEIDSPKMTIEWNGVDVPKVMGISGDGLADAVDLQVFVKLLASQRKITIHNGDFHFQGVELADLPFIDVNLDFVAKSTFEYALVARGKIAAPVPPEFVLAINYHGDPNDLSHSMVDFELKTSNMRVEDIIDFVPNYNRELFHGQLNDLDVRGAIQNGKLRYVNSDFQIDNLHIDKLSMHHGQGQLEFRASSERVRISASNIDVSHQDFYSDSKHIVKLHGDLVNTFEDQMWFFSTKGLEIDLFNMQIFPSIKGVISENTLHSLDLTCTTKHATVPKVLKLLPDKKMSKNLYSWLNNSLTSGKVESLLFSYKPEDLRFAMDFENTTILYSPDWPAINNVDANLTIVNNNIKITTSKASVIDCPITEITAELEDITIRPFKPFKITGAMDTQLEKGLEFLQQTPLRTTLASKISPFKPQGAIHLGLELLLDTNQADIDIVIDGKINLEKARLELPDMDMPLTDIAGNIAFTKTSMSAPRLKLKLLGHNATALMNYEIGVSNGLEVQFSSPLAIVDVKRLFPALENLNISGFTHIDGAIQFPWDARDAEHVLKISTNLQGVAIDYPQPYAKNASSSMPFNLRYHISSKDIKSISFDIPELMDANLYIRDGELYGGNIALGDAISDKKVSDSLLISGNLKKFVWNEWKPYLSTEDKYAVLPLNLDLAIDTLSFNDTNYTKNKVKYDFATRHWYLKNTIVEGELYISEKEDKINVNLKNLKVEASTTKDNKFVKYIEEKHQSKELPFIEFYCESLHFNDRDYRKVGLQLMPRPYGYEISELSIANDNVLVEAQGQWQMDSGKESTLLSGNAYTKNFGFILRDWQFGNSITRGAGEFNFSLQWNGSPMAFNHLDLEGASHFDLRNGTLTSVDPGLGRIVGLLSIDSIQRRLQFDFRDVTSEGMAFDKFIADIKFLPGSVESNNIVINSPSARIELSGNLNLNSRQLDFIMYVTPKVGAGLPVAAAIAIGNPALGAAIWLVDKASGSKISEISKSKYKVTGTWDNPNIVEIIPQKVSSVQQP